MTLRIGTTSYIINGGLLPNAHFLADRVQDVELVLFAVDNGPCNFPSPAVVERLGELDLSYTVHLPRDVRLDEEGTANHPSMRLARQVIDLTKSLSPYAYVMHLDGQAIRSPVTTRRTLRQWQDQACRALEMIAKWAGNPSLIALENLEGYPPGLLFPIMERVPVSRCVDIGHLLLDEHDPLPYLLHSLPRTRVVHLHGVAQKAHRSLDRLAPEQLDRIIHSLMAKAYDGVLTLEVFGETDLDSSLEAFSASMERYDGRRLDRQSLNR